MTSRTTPKLAIVATVLALSAAACGASDESAALDTTPSSSPSTVVAGADETNAEPELAPATSVADTAGGQPAAAATETAETADTTDFAAGEAGDSASTFQVDVWADNWMAVYVDGELIGEDSVPITTERSFNAETFVFEASVPFTIAIEAKDFTETDSGLEYIGERNQQIGDGGLIAQITDLATGDVVAVTDAEWSALVVHQAPLNPDCEDDPDPDSTCESLIVDTPVDWTSAGFDDRDWSNATEWSESAVSPKDGYDTIDWDPSARLVWGYDLKLDNTVLLRSMVT